MPVTSQPTSDGGNNVKIEVPELDFERMIKGEWKVGHLECLKNPPICKLILNKYTLVSMVNCKQSLGVKVLTCV